MGCCYQQSPILIDVEGDGFDMTSADDGVRFDISGSGTPVRLSWTAGRADDGWLALDRNGNGRVDHGKELFGNFTDQPFNKREKNGFEALAEFDRLENGGNRDGRITDRDAVFERLWLWQDRNHNGVSEPDELLKFASLGVTALHLRYEETKWMDRHGNWFRYRAPIDREGRGRGTYKWAYDVYLVRSELP